MITLRVQCDECAHYCDIPIGSDSAGSLSGGLFEAHTEAQLDAVTAATQGKPWIEVDTTELLPDGWHVEERGTYPPTLHILCPEHAP